MKKPIVLILPLLMVPFLSACEENIYTVAFDTDGGTTINKQIITEIIIAVRTIKVNVKTIK